MREVLLSLHAYHLGDPPSKSVCELDQCPIHQWLLRSDDLQPLDTTFDDALKRIEQTGAYVEPDGSFTRGGRSHGTSWSVGGMLYDEGSRLAYVDVTGKAPTNVWKEMMEAILPSPETDQAFTLVVYFKAEGVFADVSDFLDWLSQVQSEFDQS